MFTTKKLLCHIFFSLKTQGKMMSHDMLRNWKHHPCGQITYVNFEFCRGGSLNFIRVYNDTYLRIFTLLSSSDCSQILHNFIVYIILVLTLRTLPVVRCVPLTHSHLCTGQCTHYVLWFATVCVSVHMWAFVTHGQAYKYMCESFLPFLYYNVLMAVLSAPYHNWDKEQSLFKSTGSFYWRNQGLVAAALNLCLI